MLSGAVRAEESKAPVMAPGKATIFRDPYGMPHFHAAQEQGSYTASAMQLWRIGSNSSYSQLLPGTSNDPSFPHFGDRAKLTGEKALRPNLFCLDDLPAPRPRRTELARQTFAKVEDRLEDTRRGETE